MKQIFFVATLLFIGLVVITSSSAWGAGADEKQIIVIFRFDDPSSISNTNVELKVIDAFQQNNLPCTLGVVPFIITGYGGDPTPRDVVPLNDIKADILKKGIATGLIEVALHGYSHQTIRSKFWGGYSEFGGLDYTSQALRIEKGKAFLESILNVKLTTFIPPFDNFDHNTIKLVESFGFEVFSSSMDQPNDLDDSDKIKFLPDTCGLSDLRYRIEAARQISDNQPIIVVLIHHKDFWDANRVVDSNKIDSLIKLLNWIKVQSDIKVITLGQAAKVVKDASTSRFLKFKDRFVLRLVPPVIDRYFKFPVGVYYSTIQPNIKTELYAVVLAFYSILILCITAIAFLVGKVVLPRSGVVRLISKYGLPILLILGISILEIRHVIKYKGAVILAMLIAINIGIRYSRRRIKKQDYQLSGNRNSDEC